MGNLEQVESCLIDARRKLAGTSDELVLADSELRYEEARCSGGKWTTLRI